jgi:serine/threonine protein kinase
MEVRLGSAIGSYRLERRLGEGASGLVFAARTPAGEAVAVKVLRPERGDDEVLKSRFLREARLARTIESDHIAPILDVGEVDGLTYLALPLYAQSLAQRLVHEPLGLEETVSLAAQLGRGLDLLHGQGILHRDLKPSNVLYDRAGNAALADFGLARAAESTRLTEEGQVVGTLHYLAPELIDGAEATRATDVYALGCVLYECVAGRPPFTGRRPAEIGFAHLVEPPPDPRDRRPGLSGDFVLALLTPLAKDPGLRPPTGTALARMLHLARSAAPA